jgi:hypothetical protein
MAETIGDESERPESARPAVVEKFRTEDLSGLDAFEYLHWRLVNRAPYEHLVETRPRRSDEGATKKTLVRGRATKNGHVMTAAERKRESRARRRKMTKMGEIVSLSLLPLGGPNVTLQVVENKEEPGTKNRV